MVGAFHMFKQINNLLLFWCTQNYFGQYVLLKTKEKVLVANEVCIIPYGNNTASSSLLNKFDIFLPCK